MAFTNTYSFEGDATVSGQKSFAGTKTLIGRPWQNGDEFTFELMAVGQDSVYADGTSVPTDGTYPMPTTGEKQPDGNVRVTITNEDDAYGAAAGNPVSFNFGDIAYDKPGTYNYIIREVRFNAGEDGFVPNVAYTQTRYYVRVVVTDNGDGALTPDATMYTTSGGNYTPNFDDPVVTADFENTWSADDAPLIIEGVKTYNDSTNPGSTIPPTNKFFFRITAEDGGPMPKLEAGDPVDQGDGYAVVTTLQGGRILFGTSNFTDDMVGNTYNYTIEEVVQQGDSYEPVDEAITPNESGAYVLNGMTYDPTTYTLAVTVQTTADGGIEAVPVYNNGTENVAQPSFTNSYDPADETLTGDVAIHGTKTLDGRNMTDDEVFTFTLEGADQTTRTAMTDGTITFDGAQNASYTEEVTNAADNTPAGFNLGDMVINKPGEYTFYMSETGYTKDDTSYTGAQLDSKINGIAFYDHVCTVTVDVDDVNGELVANVQYSTENGGSMFTNRYTASEAYGTDVDLTVSKTLDGRDMARGEFTFEISATGDNSDAAAQKLTDAKVAGTFTNPQVASDGVASAWKILGNLVFNQDDAGQTFTYEVKEQVPDDAAEKGLTYDKSIYQVAIQVIDDADGTMHTVTTVTRVQNEAGDADTEVVGTFDSSTGAVAPTVAFVNRYHGNAGRHRPRGDVSPGKEARARHSSNRCDEGGCELVCRHSSQSGFHQGCHAGWHP